VQYADIYEPDELQVRLCMLCFPARSGQVNAAEALDMPASASSTALSRMHPMCAASAGTACIAAGTGS
jgi:hypothetical protein